MSVKGVKTSAYVDRDVLDRFRDLAEPHPSLGELVALGLDALEAPGRAAEMARVVGERVSEAVRAEVRPAAVEAAEAVVAELREVVRAECRAALGELRGGSW